MKTIITAMVLLGFHFNLIAQRPDFSGKCKNEMSKLSYLAGHWSGKAKVSGQGGETTLDQTENIHWSLDSLVLTIEGIGKKQGEVNFHALALVNFDPFTQQYKLKSYVKEGYSTDAYFKIAEPNSFEWGFDIPTGGKTRYKILLDATKKTWYETGEYSADGKTWYRFIEMNLVKQ